MKSGARNRVNEYYKYRGRNNLKKQRHRPIRMKRGTGLNHAALTKAFPADVEHVEYH